MPFLNEIKSRLGVSFLCCTLTFLVCFSLKESVLFVFSSVAAGKRPENFYFIFTDLPAVFYFYFTAASTITQQIFIISLVHQTTLFLAPSFKTFIIFYAKTVLKKLCYLYFLVLTIFNFLFLPSFVSFFLGMSENYNNHSTCKLFFEANLPEFLGFYIDLYYNLILLTAVSIVVFLYLSSSFEAKSRKVLYYTLCLIVVFFLPPEPISQFATFLVLALVFESLFFLSLTRGSLVRATS